MKADQFYISSIDANAHTVAGKRGMGVEIAEFCTAWNMDAHDEISKRELEKKLEGIPNRILHAPFNELFPCAIDPKARELAALRYTQAISLAQSYGAKKVVIHGGYNPFIYYPCWYTEQSVLFWKEYLQTLPDGIIICLENVLEEEPEMLRDILSQVNDPRLRMCLDVGHVNAYSNIPVIKWLEACSPFISHFHIHNNYGDADTHNGLLDGSMPMEALLFKAEKLCPDASITLELMDSSPSAMWLCDHVFKEEGACRKN